MGKYTNNSFNWKFLWDFILLFFAVVMCIAQAVNGSWPGMIGFAFIAYIIIKLMVLDLKQ